jgi:hypothetical protein
MISTLAWMSALAIGVAATVAGAGADAPGLHMALTAATAVGLAALALVQRRRLLAGGAGEAALSSATVIAMAVVWGWAALSVLITYVFVSTWGEWWQYVLGAGVVALLCLFFASTLARDASAGREDATMLNLARYLTIGQLAGMVIAMIGLIADAKMPRDPKKPDWGGERHFLLRRRLARGDQRGRLAAKRVLAQDLNAPRVTATRHTPVPANKRRTPGCP